MRQSAPDSEGSVHPPVLTQQPPVQQPLQTDTLEKPGPELPLRILQEQDPSTSDGDSEPNLMEGSPDVLDTVFPGSLSPSESSQEYLEMLKRLASTLGVQLVTEPAHDTDVVHKLVQADLPSATLLPVLPVHLHLLKEAWEHPPAVHPSSKPHDAFYRIDKTSAPFLFSHPPPNSMIVHSSAKAKSSKTPSPPDHDQKKVDVFARKNYTMATMLARIHTYLSYMSAYSLSMASQILAHCQNQSSLTSALVHIQPLAKGISLVSKQQIGSIHQAVSYTSRILANSVAQRRHAWLASTSLQPDVRLRVEDLSFDWAGLFNSATDETLSAVDDSRKKAKNLGLQQPPQRPRQRPWRQYPPYHSRYFRRPSPRRSDSWRQRQQAPRQQTFAQCPKAQQGSKHQGLQQKRQV